ncbi:hypothetical protein COCHEDRAFT_1100939, partial [Bipolaris maydis C5]
IYVPLYIRLNLIKKLYKSPKYRYIEIKEILELAKIAKVFTILYIRTKVYKILGNYLVYY